MLMVKNTMTFGSFLLRRIKEIFLPKCLFRLILSNKEMWKNVLKSSNKLPPQLHQQLTKLTLNISEIAVWMRTIYHTMIIRVIFNLFQSPPKWPKADKKKKKPQIVQSLIPWFVYLIRPFSHSPDPQQPWKLIQKLSFSSSNRLFSPGPLNSNNFYTENPTKTQKNIK